MILSVTEKGVTRITSDGDAKELMADAGILAATIMTVILRQIGDVGREKQEEMAIDMIDYCRMGIFHALDNKAEDPV